MGTKTIGEAYTEDADENLRPASGAVTPPLPDWWKDDDPLEDSIENTVPMWKYLGPILAGTIILGALFGTSLLF